ncbi:MAG: YraN family protein [Planctomycetota bacterium]
MLSWLIDRWRLGRLSSLSTAQVGAMGERIAARYLASEGMRVIERNTDMTGGEIDLIALDQDQKTVVFVEVKTRRLPSDRHERYRPEVSITPQKRKKLVRLAERVTRDRGWEDRQKRIDVIAVELASRAAPVIRHHRAAVDRSR